MVFAPILFVQQEAGQLYSDIAIAISGAIIASMLVAIFVVPVALSRFGSDKDFSQEKQFDLSSRWLQMVTFFSATQRRARWVASVFILSIIGLAYLFMPAAEYLPEGEEPKAFSLMIAPPSYNLSEMERIGAELREHFNAYLNADPEDFIEGRTDMPPLAYYSMTVSIGRVWFLSAPVDPSNINAMMEAITTKFRSYPNMRAFSTRGSIISSNDGGTRAVAVDIAGNDVRELYRTAEAVYREAESRFDNPQINSDPGSLTLNQPLIEIKPRWQRLAELGINNNDFGFAVAAMSDGAYVDEFILNDDKVDIFMFSGSGNRQTIEELSTTPIVTPQRQVLPMNALADLIESKNSDSVRRVDSNRTVTVYIIPPREIALETAEQIVRNEMIPALWRQGDIAQGTKVSISGAADQLEATKASLSGNFLVAIVLIYLLLVAIFTHWRYPLFILATVPLGMAGGLLGLVAVNGINSGLTAIGLGGTHQPFDMITMLGFLILLGTVVNNPILIVDQTRRNVLDLGMKVTEAVQRAVQKRLKPILMSTATTVFGLAPLVLIPGEGTELYRGVGIIVLGGILVSMLLSLTFLPSLLVALLNDPVEELDIEKAAGATNLGK